MNAPFSPRIERLVPEISDTFEPAKAYLSLSSYITSVTGANGRSGALSLSPVANPIDSSCDYFTPTTMKRYVRDSKCSARITSIRSGTFGAGCGIASTNSSAYTDAGIFSRSSALIPYRRGGYMISDVKLTDESNLGLSQQKEQNHQNGEGNTSEIISNSTGVEIPQATINSTTDDIDDKVNELMARMRAISGKGHSKGGKQETPSELGDTDSIVRGEEASAVSAIRAPLSNGRPLKTSSILASDSFHYVPSDTTSEINDGQQDAQGGPSAYNDVSNCISKRNVSGIWPQQYSRRFRGRRSDSSRPPGAVQRASHFDVVTDSCNNLSLVYNQANSCNDDTAVSVSGDAEDADNILWPFEIKRITEYSRLAARNGGYKPPDLYGGDVDEAWDPTKKVFDLPSITVCTVNSPKRERESERLRKKIYNLEQRVSGLASYKLPTSQLIDRSLLYRTSSIESPRPSIPILCNSVLDSNTNLHGRKSGPRPVFNLNFASEVDAIRSCDDNSGTLILKPEGESHNSFVGKFNRNLREKDQSVRSSFIFSDDLSSARDQEMSNNRTSRRRSSIASFNTVSSPRNKRSSNIEQKRSLIIACRKQGAECSGVNCPSVSDPSSPSTVDWASNAESHSKNENGERKERLEKIKRGQMMYNNNSKTTHEDTEKDEEIRKNLRLIMTFHTDFENFTAETDTMMPPQELHLYQLYCYNTNKVIIFRPISPAAPSMYAGNFFVSPKYCDEHGIPLMVSEISEDMCFDDVQAFTTGDCRIKGKGISVSLKSSPYLPIEGFIPINPSLSKTYSESRRKERILEDSLLYASDKISASLLRKIRFQRNKFKAATSVAMKDIVLCLSKSEDMLNDVLEEYRMESAVSFEKEKISLQYINIINESQFLGKTVATWRGMELYYKRLTDDLDIERTSDGNPIFYARKDDMLYIYNPATNELNKTSEFTRKLRDEARSMCPVYVLTHRSFVISPISKRIEPDPRGDFIIGPDFDGFAYASSLPEEQYTDTDAYSEFCEKRLDICLKPSFGLVSPFDEEHVLEVRALTQWKQNHGYECSNTVKTQDITDGPHLVVLPNMTFRCLYNFTEIIRFYREAWQKGYPMMLNPNWKVVLDTVTFMPIVYGNDLSMPVVGDCGMGLITHTLSVEGKNFVNIKSEAIRYIDDMLAQKKGSSSSVFRPLLLAAHHDIVLQMAEVVAQKALADKFFRLRRWLLLPPQFLHHLLIKCYCSGDGYITSDAVEGTVRRGEREMDCSYDEAYFETKRVKFNEVTHDVSTLESSVLESTYKGDNSLVLLMSTLNEYHSLKSTMRRRTRDRPKGSCTPRKSHLDSDRSSRVSNSNSTSISPSSSRHLRTYSNDSCASSRSETVMNIIPFSAEFEEYRNAKIQPLLKEFDEACADFDLIFEQDCGRYTSGLRMYVDHFYSH